MQTEIARHGPMIRCICLSDGGLQPRGYENGFKVKGRVRKAVSPWMGYSLR